MHYALLSENDMKAMDALKSHHGGAKKIDHTIETMRDFETRKRILSEKGYGEMIAEAEKMVKSFPKVEDFERKNHIFYDKKFGTARSQVSGFQGAKVTHHCMKKIAQGSQSGELCFVPNEMISVVALSDNYVYNGDLLATLTMAENIMKVSKFCNTNLIGIPQPESRFRELESLTKKTFERIKVDDSQSRLLLKNQGTFFGNFGGIEVANDNHLVYLDGITRTALATGSNFFLNPSWSTIVAICYYGRDIANIHIKVSMLLSTQNLIQLRMLLNIMKEYLRDDGTSPIYEINIGNGASADTFIQASKELKSSGIKGVSFSAHIYINPDLGMENFNWTENMHKVLESGTDMTFKYESDGQAREMDTMATYFLSEADRNASADKIGDVIYFKSLRASKDGMDLMKRGIRAEFGGSSYE
ncbi:MAG: hypothetical protein JXI33_04175 [Candidatus Aminicenantes bacterium]|nr:hypothetical protein [Candidatus Aminicenantes bacterium]